MADVYEVWEQSYDTFGEHEWRMVYRFHDPATARKMEEKLNAQGWGYRAQVRLKILEPPILDATPEDVEAWWNTNRYDPFPGMEDA